MEVPPDETSRVTRFLATFDLPTATSVSRQHGYDATVWRVELTDGRILALRLLRPDVRADNELAALRLAARHGHPVPRIVAAGRVDGRDAIVMTWCAGHTIAELLASGGDVDKLGLLFGDAHARLHQPLDDGTSLCHLDYQPFNVLADAGVITGIVDWSNARTGDARADIAWTTAVLAFAPSLRPDLSTGVPAFTAAWRRGYAARRRFPEHSELRPFLAAAARRQHDDWTRRVRSGEAPPALAEATAALVARWSD
jgi:Ser/Thr protein kinase RdoA (MazF antagonist)